VPTHPYRPVHAPLGGQLCGQLAAGRNVPSMLAVTVKPFDQRELHATVTICPELGISHQKVTQKWARTDCARDLRALCANLLIAREYHPGLASIPGGSSVARCRSQYLIVRRCYRSLELAFDSETVQAARTPRHRHHPPARDPPPLVQPTGGVKCGSVQVATYRRCLAVTVKPFDQRQLHKHRHHLPGITNCQSES
jgi:hypothetical protein